MKNTIIFTAVLLNLVNFCSSFRKNGIFLASTHRQIKISGSNPLQELSTFETFSFNFKKSNLIKITAFATGLLACSSLAWCRPEGVNKPELLPAEKTSLIDLANYLSKGQEKKIVESIGEIEKNTGFKLRILTQSYPNTPGAAVKDYWGVDENTMVMVIDKGEGFSSKGIPSNPIRLNIGKNIEDTTAGMFWTRLTNKLGNSYYIKDNGIDFAIINAVEAIKYCLQDKTCKDLPFQL